MDPTQCGSETLQNRMPTYQQEVMCKDTKVAVTVTKEGKHVDKWIDGQAKHSQFGMDVEWKPNHSRGEDNKVSLLQISSPTDCLLVQMLHLDYVPSSLRQLLKDPTKTMAGVGITEDARKLARDHGLDCKGLVELGKHAGPGREHGSPRSLKSLSKQMLNLDMTKSRKVTLSNWAQPHLDSKQVEYACLDAWAAGSIRSRFSRTTASNPPPLAGGKPSNSTGPKPSSGGGVKPSNSSASGQSSSGGSRSGSGGGAKPSNGGGSRPGSSGGSRPSSGGGTRPSSGGGTRSSSGGGSRWTK